jgi:mannose-6-phosphate isomerase class I
MKYFRGRDPALRGFELFCKSHNLSQGEIISDLIDRFLKENDAQQTLDAYPKRYDPATRVFEYAALVGAKSELERVVELMEQNPDTKESFQVDMLRALKIAEPIYHRTRDQGLSKLLQRAELALKTSHANNWEG